MIKMHGFHTVLRALTGFIVIYEKFIKRGRAPLEINISDMTRNDIAMWYSLLYQIKFQSKSINGIRNNINTKQASSSKCFKLCQSDLETFSCTASDSNKQLETNFNFLDLWESLLICSNQVVGLMHQSVLRYFRSEMCT